MPPPRAPSPSLNSVPESALLVQQVATAWDDDAAANAAVDAAAIAIDAAQLLQTVCSSNVSVAQANPSVSCAHSPTTPLTLGGASIVFSDTLINGSVSAVVLEPPDVPPPSGEGAPAALVSPVVSVSSDEPMMPLPSPGSSMVIVTIPIANAPPSNNRSCVAHDADVYGNSTCIAGCCIDGQCVCRFGYTGDFCEFELRCVHLQPGEPSWQADDACMAREHHQNMAQNSLVCSCRQLGLIAVMSFRVTPPTNAGGLADWDRVAPNFAASASRTAIPLLLFTLVFLLAAACADRASAYVDASLPSLPRALAPSAPFAWRDELHGNILTHTCMLRCVFVWPGFTPYTHAQGVMVLANNFAVNALLIGLFFGQRTEVCTYWATLIAAVLSNLGGLIVWAFRLLFKWANFSNKELKAVYKAHKRARMMTRSTERAAMQADKSKKAKEAAGGMAAVGTQQKHALPISSVELGGALGGSRVADNADGSTATLAIGSTDAAPRRSLTDVIVAWKSHSGLFPEAPARALLRAPHRSTASSVWLSVTGRDVVAAPDGLSLGIELRDGPKVQQRAPMVSVLRIRRPALSILSVWRSVDTTPLWVEVARNALPDSDLSARKLRECVMRHSRAPPLLCASARPRKVFIAWALNLGLFLLSGFALVYVQLSRAHLRRMLQASALDDTEYEFSFYNAFCLGALQSVLLVDGIKVLCMTASSPGAAFEKLYVTRSKVGRKIVKKLYKALDFMA